MNKVKIEDIIDDMEMQSDEAYMYLHRKTGKIVYIFDGEIVVDCENVEDYPEWKQENIEELQEKFETDEYVQLPTKYDIHEYNIMKNFCEDQDGELKDELFDAISGRGAFRMFKNVAYRHNILDKWYEYKKEALKEIAIDWCEENEINYTV